MICGNLISLFCCYGCPNVIFKLLFKTMNFLKIHISLQIIAHLIKELIINNMGYIGGLLKKGMFIFRGFGEFGCHFFLLCWYISP